MHQPEDLQPGAPRPRKRRPRFTRAAPQPLRLTHDDLRLLAYVERFRFLRSTHLAQLLPHRSHHKLVNRLGVLYHAGYLDRPRAQLDYYSRSGSAPMVYALASRGAAGLAQAFDALPEARRWADKNRTASRPYIEHALLVADFMVPLEAAIAARQNVALIDAHAMHQARPVSLNPTRESWMLTSRYVQDGITHTFSANPDAVFGLHFRQLERRSYFFVEADRATMTIERFKRRLYTYLAAHRDKQHVERHGLSNLRILTVTTSAERVGSMLDAVNELTDCKGSAMFLFTDRETLSTHGDPLTLPWSSTAGIISIGRPPRGPIRP